MTSPALMWLDDDRLNVAGLKPDASNTIGRLAGSTVVVDDPTVSRQQARVSFDGARFLAENLSSTNPTRLNGTQLQAPTPLSDGDRLTAGVMDLTFHDLAVGDRLSGPMCSHCGRENSSTQRDCWYCGTSLVSAATTIRQRLQVAARIVTRDGARYDLYPK
ncbi:MAG: FHA domain-containing protein, partial [Chloroflexi bacterium]|nr:FHA domain-containing protein [Chloroflexota bacterium]